MKGTTMKFIETIKNKIKSKFEKTIKSKFEKTINVQIYMKSGKVITIVVPANFMMK